MNDEIYQRKDVADEKYNHLFDLVNDLHRRIDDTNNYFSHVLAVIAICFGMLAFGIPLVFYYLQSLPH